MLFTGYRYVRLCTLQTPATYKNSHTPHYMASLASMANLPKIPGCFLGNVWKRAQNAKVHLDVYVDYACPFSKKIFDTLTGVVYPHFNSDADGPTPLKITFMQVPQPWHVQSALLHEAVITARALSPELVDDFQAAVFANQPQFVDVEVYDKSRRQINEELAEIAASVGVDRAAFLQYLQIDTTDGKRNSGNQATRVLKLYTKHHRQLGVHVTPTCRINGIEVNTSSGWTLEQWIELLEPLMKVADL